MVIRLLAAAIALALSAGLAQSREAVAPKTQSEAAASTADPMDVPRGMRDWFAKSVGDILTDEGPAREEKPVKNR